MSGDQSGSPRRDERQHVGSLPHDEDVRVAGPDETAADLGGGDPSATAWDQPVVPPGDDLSDFSGEEPTSAARRPGPARLPKRGGGRRRAAAGGTARRNGLRAAAVAAGAAVVVGGGAVAAFALSGDDETTVRPDRPLADAAAAVPTPTIDPKVMEKVRHDKALERAVKQARQGDGEELELQAMGKPIPTKKPEPEKTEEKPKSDEGDGGDGDGGGGTVMKDPVPAGKSQAIAKKLMPDFGFTGDGQFACLVKLWDKESSWNVHADNPSSDAYGIPQANPGSKMSSAGSDWRNNPRTQIKWGLGYIKDRYDTPCGAWEHSESKGFY